jgi:Flp pilus assembly protein protease CpaA
MHSMTVAEMIVVAWCLVVAMSDLHARRIPNMLTLGMCGIAVCWLLLTGHSMLNATLQSTAIGAAISLLLTLPAYAARLLGAADAKLLLAIALVAGSDLTLFSFVIAALLAAVLGMAYLLIAWLRARPFTGNRWLPFGAALGVGLLCAIGITN